MEKSMSIKVAINGYGTIGKRVADAVDAQGDMEIIGVTKTRPAFGCDLAVRKGYPLYCTYDDPDRIAAFAEAGYTCHGGLSDLLAVADVVVDCSPGKVGAANKEAYVNAGVKYIFQGGEKHAMAGMSYTSSANHAENLNAAGTRCFLQHHGSLTNPCPLVRTMRLAQSGVHHDSKGSRSRRLLQRSHQCHKTGAEGSFSPRARCDDREA